METLHFKDFDFTKHSLDVLESYNDGVLYAITGNFPNCFNQCFYMITFDDDGRDTVDFFFNRLSLAKEFLHRFNKHHSVRYYRNRLDSRYCLPYVLKLLYDDSINRTRFENPDKQKVIEYFASCCSFDFKLVPNGKHLYSLVPIEKPRE